MNIVADPPIQRKLVGPSLYFFGWNNIETASPRRSCIWEPQIRKLDSYDQAAANYVYTTPLLQSQNGVFAFLLPSTKHMAK